MEQSPSSRIETPSQNRLRSTSRAIARALHFRRETAAAPEEESPDWAQALGNAVERCAQDLRHAGTDVPRGSKPAYQLVAPGNTRISLTVRAGAIPVFSQRAPLLDLGDGTLVSMLPGTSVRLTDGTVSSRYKEDGAPLAFTLDTKPLKRVFSTDSSGSTVSVEPQGAHYEAFNEAGGLRAYRLDESQALVPVKPQEGQQLVQLLNNSQPVTR